LKFFDENKIEWVIIYNDCDHKPPRIPSVPNDFAKELRAYKEREYFGSVSKR
jgi:hypothetical protein